jgi:glycine oxidase
VSALLKATKHRGVEAATGAAVTEVVVEGERAAGVKTERTHFSAATIVNCAGAWAGQVGPRRFPARPIKGQMLALIPSSKALLRHVVRSPEVYLVPRSDGRIVIGSTLEDVGYDKRVEPDTVQRLHQAAANLVPELGQAKMLEAWAGLRPGTPDNLPMLGASDIAGYFVAAGHYRDGILLAPATAHVMAQVVQGRKPDVNLEAFSPMRF